MCFVFIFTHILDWQTLLMLLFSAAVKVSIIILLFLHFFSLKKNDINAISPSHFPSIPPSFRLHHHPFCHHSASIIIIMPPSILLLFCLYHPSSSSLCHHFASIPSHHHNHFTQKTILHFGLIMVSIP